MPRKKRSYPAELKRRSRWSGLSRMCAWTSGWALLLAVRFAFLAAIGVPAGHRRRGRVRPMGRKVQINPC